jgi:hypothetical protein
MPKKSEPSKATTGQHSQPEPQQREFVFADKPVPIWIDSVSVSRQRERPVLMMTFFSLTPETSRLHEVQRVVMGNDHAQRMVDALCKSLGYYPEKPSD